MDGPSAVGYANGMVKNRSAMIDRFAIQLSGVIDQHHNLPFVIEQHTIDTLASDCSVDLVQRGFLHIQLYAATDTQDLELAAMSPEEIAAMCVERRVNPAQ